MAEQTPPRSPSAVSPQRPTAPVSPTPSGQSQSGPSSSRQGEPTQAQVQADVMNKAQLEDGETPTHQDAAAKPPGPADPPITTSDLMTDKMIAEVQRHMQTLSDSYAALGRELQKQDTFMRQQSQQIEALTTERDDLRQRLTSVRAAV